MRSQLYFQGGGYVADRAALDTFSFDLWNLIGHIDAIFDDID